MLATLLDTLPTSLSFVLCASSDHVPGHADLVARRDRARFQPRHGRVQRIAVALVVFLARISSKAKFQGHTKIAQKFSMAVQMRACGIKVLIFGLVLVLSWNRVSAGYRTRNPLERWNAWRDRRKQGFRHQGHP